MTRDQFKQWRKRLGLTQAGAGEALGVSRETIQNYEKGHSRAPGQPPTPIPRTVALACAALAAGILEYQE